MPKVTIVGEMNSYEGTHQAFDQLRAIAISIMTREEKKDESIGENKRNDTGGMVAV